MLQFGSAQQTPPQTKPVTLHQGWVRASRWIKVTLCSISGLGLVARARKSSKPNNTSCCHIGNTTDDVLPDQVYGSALPNFSSDLVLTAPATALITTACLPPFPLLLPPLRCSRRQVHHAWLHSVERTIFGLKAYETIE